MKLATYKNSTRDGRLHIVSRDNKRTVPSPDVFPTLQSALDSWLEAEGVLQEAYKQLNDDTSHGQLFAEEKCHAPLPRAYEWIDGSAYINHIVLVRKARGAEPPETLRTDPLVYQGGSGVLLGPRDPIPLQDEAYGYDFESEVCVIVDDTPRRQTPESAEQHIKLITLANDVSLRNLIPIELAKGFGFFVSKPATAFAPIAVTPDELLPHWKEGRLHLNLQTKLNGTLFGSPNAGPEMHFSFCDLIAHITKTRDLTAGTIIGSGTVSNDDRSKGSSCIAERRMLEKLNQASTLTPFLKSGDCIEITMAPDSGPPIFGSILQQVQSL